MSDEEDAEEDTGGAVPAVWGPVTTVTVNHFVFAYPDEPNAEEQEDAYNYLQSLRTLLPCGVCRQHWRRACQHDTQGLTREVVSSRKLLLKWWVARVNEVRNRRNLPSVSALDLYNEYLAQCEATRSVTLFVDAQDRVLTDTTGGHFAMRHGLDIAPAASASHSRYGVFSKDTVVEYQKHVDTTDTAALNRDPGWLEDMQCWLEEQLSGDETEDHSKTTKACLPQSWRSMAHHALHSGQRTVDQCRRTTRVATVAIGLAVLCVLLLLLYLFWWRPKRQAHDAILAAPQRPGLPVLSFLPRDSATSVGAQRATLLTRANNDMPTTTETTTLSDSNQTLPIKTVSGAESNNNTNSRQVSYVPASAAAPSGHAVPTNSLRLPTSAALYPPPWAVTRAAP